MGDTEAFDELLGRAAPMTKSVLIKRFGRGDLDYEEAIQKASIRAWQKIDTFSGDSLFSTWFYQIAKRMLLDEITKGRKIDRMTISMSSLLSEEYADESIPKFLEETDGETAATILMGKEESAEKEQILSAAMSKLSPAHYQVFDLVCNKNMTYKDAAKACGCSIGTVMSRVFYAKKYAQKHLTQIYGKGK